MQESPSSFVGRAKDLAGILARFELGARLVTLVAPGGMGKTRAATRFATVHGGLYAAHGGGAWFCDLTDARDVAAICSAVASALGEPLLRTTDEARVVAALGDAIARRSRVLVILDNAEQAAGEVASVLRVWMKVAPHARFLVTSRAVLGVPGEHLWPLEPLAVPEPGMARDALLATDAAALFVSRAREVRPDFDPGDAELAALAEIVRATDGIPLAIELCAARVRVLSLEQARARMAQPLDFLVRRDDRGRHASMRRAILDSFAQLDGAERAALAAASVFRGGFTLEAAEAVRGVLAANERGATETRPWGDLEAARRSPAPPKKGDEDAQGVSEGHALEVLEGLVARSLVRMRAEGADVRFSLFETIREMAAEELRARPEELERAAGRHARYFAQLGRSLAEEASFGGAALVRLDRELDNLAAAHARALLEAERDPAGEGGALALGLALALEPVLVRRGLFERRLVLLDGAITAALATEEGRRSPDLAAAFLSRGVARRELGYAKDATGDLETALALAGDRGDAVLEALACAHLGEIVETLGRTVEARGHFARGLARLVAAPEGRERRVREAQIRANLGHAHRREGDLSAADRETRRALALYREADCGDRLPRVLYEAGVIAMFRAAWSEAGAHFDEALVIAQRTGDRHAQAALFSAGGILAQEQGKLDVALAQHARAVQLFHEIGSRDREGSSLYYLGGAFLERGSPDEATKMLVHAFDRMGAAGFQRYEALIAGCLAAVWSDQGQPDLAAEWLAKARVAAGACGSEPGVQATLAIHEAHVELAALASSSEAERASTVARAREIEAAVSNDDVRFALRILVAAARPGLAAPPEALVILEGGAAFRLPGARAAVDLSRRAPLRRILFALAKLRVEAPGAPLPVDEVLRAGWPGEKIGAEAAANRVRVALATLRKLGLREVLRTGQGGYLIDPGIAVVVSREA